jgi:small subunit ribosomal protein S6
MQKTYELMVLLHPDLEIDVETPISKIEGLIKAAGGRVTRSDNWGKKRLAYRIAHQDFAVYVYFEIELPGAQVGELERSLLITEEVVRHLLVVHNEAKPRRDEKSAVIEKSGAENAAPTKVEAGAAAAKEEVSE